MADLQKQVLEIIDEKGNVDTFEIANQLNIEHQKVVGVAKSLSSLQNVCSIIINDSGILI